MHFFPLLWFLPIVMYTCGSDLLLGLSVSFSSHISEKNSLVETQRNNLEAWHCQENLDFDLPAVQFKVLHVTNSVTGGHVCCSATKGTSCLELLISPSRIPPPLPNSTLDSLSSCFSNRSIK